MIAVFYREILCLTVSLSMGWLFIYYIRRNFMKCDYSWILSVVPLVVPISLFVILIIISCIGLIKPHETEIFNGGFTIGVILNFLIKSTSKVPLKLKIQQRTGSTQIIWLDDKKITVAEAINKIAERLEITPSLRVSIESGKGKFIDNSTKELLEVLKMSTVASDIFGFITCTCYIHIKELEPEQFPEQDQTGKTLNLGRTPLTKLLFLHPVETKYDTEVFLTAKIPNAADDALAFYVCPVDMYAAAAPSPQQKTVRLQKWTQTASDKESVVSQVRSSGSDYHSRGHHSATGGHVPIMNGDFVVVECEDKYMSVARGWWIAWSSRSPRRSGVFKIEVIERAPQNKIDLTIDNLKETIDNIKEKIGVGSVAPKDIKELDPLDGAVLHNGDLFRLRSVKFPEFELGITSVRLTDDFCYLGLRKVDDDSNSWCLAMRFSIKARTNEGVRNLLQS